MNSHRRQFPWWTIALSLGLLFVLVGVLQGDAVDVLRKATRICFECIGIG